MAPLSTPSPTSTLLYMTQFTVSDSGLSSLVCILYMIGLQPVPSPRSSLSTWTSTVGSVVYDCPGPWSDDWSVHLHHFLSSSKQLFLTPSYCPFRYSGFVFLVFSWFFLLGAELLYKWLSLCNFVCGYPYFWIYIVFTFILPNPHWPYQPSPSPPIHWKWRSNSRESRH